MQRPGWLFGGRALGLVSSQGAKCPVVGNRPMSPSHPKLMAPTIVL